MHVLGITDHLGNIGGAEISAYTILLGLTNHHSIDNVTVVGVDDPTVPRFEFDDITVVPVQPPPGSNRLPDFVIDLLIERRLANAARKHAADADIVHAHHRRSALALTHLNPQAPTITTVRDFWPVCPISIYHIGGECCTGCDDRLADCVSHQEWDGVGESVTKAYLRAKRRHQHSVLADSDAAVFIAKHLQERLDGTVPLPERTTTIYNPVDIDVDVVPEQFDDPTFVTASSLAEAKGIGTAVQAMGYLVDEYPKSQLVICGDGPLRAELEALAADVAPDAVQFRGRVDIDSVYGAMAGATATLFPSVWDEPFGRVTVESMMLGTPVVGSDVGGIAEVIDDGETGLLVPPADETTLAEALRGLIGDEHQRRQMEQAGREQAQAFEPKRIAEEHVELYQSLANMSQ